MTFLHRLAPLSVALLLTASIAPAAEMKKVEDQVAPRLQAFPAKISLTNRRESQEVVVQLLAADGSNKDVTDLARMEIALPAVARLASGFVEPLADGQTELVIQYESFSTRIPIEVSHSKDPAEFRFRNDVLPVLTRAGCNTGKCHGSASGKDGFRLSLFGYDPAGDHYRITRELSGRRINLAAPADCLLVNKAIGQVNHTGGQCIEPDTAHYQTLIQWLTAGAQPDPEDTAKPVRIEVLPQNAIFRAPGDDQKLLVTAYYSDGTDRDVTDQAVFISNNDSAAKVSVDGIVSAMGPGSAFVMARFDQFTQGASIIVRPGTAFQFPDIAAHNFIDEHVHDHWRNMHLLPSEVCSDEVFMRRVYLDLIGLLPSAEERHSFLNDQASDKRERLVDLLLQRDEFLDLWVMKWAETLQVRTNNGVSSKGLMLYDRWLRDRVRSGESIDKIVNELIPATGGTFENPATNYFQTETTPELLAENVAQVFLGTRIQCAQCHNHPFDRWTMDDYYGFASFFSQIGYKQAQDPRELTVFNSGEGELRHPVRGEKVLPKFLGEAGPDLNPEDDVRKSLADWLTSKRNSEFARNTANIVWSHFFGIGIVEPVDDIRVSNPPSNPALFKALGDRFVAYNFDLRSLVRDICNSRTYQLSTHRNPSNEFDERHFSHGRIRRLRAEILLDCINQVTQASDRFPGLPEGARAVQIADGRTQNYFLTTFGRSTRQTPCTCEVKTTPTLSQALHLLNGETTSGKIAQGEVVESLLEEDSDPVAVANRLYEKCLSRLPTVKESKAIHDKLAAATDTQAALTDLFWALLNSNEFVFNH
ncbi:DUF1549 domain-containing protein [Schlesneria sp. T3-172]|uniref:DUF1549 domain-containing protein n=1 Tax=Schlesneria sphaerica TaxID=3373610 RepID=UPI0037C606F9